jgi:two-component system sensor histidine kinase RegB
MVAIVSQTVAIAAAYLVLDGPLPLRELALTIGALALWNALNYGPVHAQRVVHDGEVVLHLCVDIVAFTAVLYFTGGPTNPFVSLYLVPISLAATSLPTAHAWLTTAMCGVGYSFLWWRSVPLPPVHARFGTDFDLHLTGMWVNFVIAAVLIVLFVGRMAVLVRQRDRELAALREQALRDQQIVELGTLAAGTAHELNTPLSTLAILAGELEDTVTDEKQKQQLAVMLDEIRVINERLNRIVGGVGAERSAGARHVRLRAFLEEIFGRWSDAHPDIALGVEFEASPADPSIAAEATIEQAIRNVLDNAAHASTANGRNRVGVRVRADRAAVTIAVTDEGAGLDPGVRDEIGLKIVSTKEGGLGIGLLLSRAALQRFGGRLELTSRASGGVEARIHLPLDELLADVR